MEESLRRQMYRRVWYQAKQAKKSNNYDEGYWEHQLDKYRKNKHFVTPVSKTKEYRKRQAKKYYHQHTDRVRMTSAKGCLRRLIQSDKTPLKDLQAIYTMLEIKTEGMATDTPKSIPTYTQLRGRKQRWDKGVSRAKEE